MEQITLAVKRTGTGAEAGPHWQSFSVPVIAESMSVLDALIWVQRNADPSLAYRCACRVGMCGSCGTVINGREGLACRTLVRQLLDGRGGTVRVEPMRHLPVVRDLVVDPAVFYQRLLQVVPYLSPVGDDRGPVAISPDSKERRAIDPQRECVYCALCYSACSVAGLNADFLGPAALNRAFALVSDSRDSAARERLRVAASEEGLWRCHTIFECSAACPKGIPISVAIQGLKRRVVVNKLKRLIGIR
ncbi:MAG: succinate dehydrogenase iron-sulfur subunit [Dehalococcoidia bacterium]|jgi:succinate dehydrogenase/fumarate reductase iron-sulfur protein|nr:succinate dehydrogenase iron-sulfur subunit [Dehalococcoidia bacterium]MDP6229051.1 succinate dehydrogenase iron-sulfur subunit [Dehalococcoidia bacterium]MDP7202204.1 succinate dehydrogenase iron-sulfur subunit [Dehalococcoidia bacterium]MDP7511800.1 succinate dehydrogenase iron-sulfur subunit [Dehalococcoidia bacterium]HJN86522.1 succinate dehydrogenase iron-sulfur subunit [Dehalococcoidia bacterium]